MEEKIYEKVLDIVSEQFNTDKSDLSKETRFKEDLQADSISVVELIMAFEQEFGGTISDEESEHIQTIGDIVSYIASKS
ncbi:acyl carrier protein [Granulicatella sp. zg-ZJ]|uniref:acyl carrier protein n=1 Tax=unclassified Granulicatella TaxID=2630493 RepID=UPI0013C1D6C8|nr:MULTISPECIES: acyl carrier protein [unclassified Granulicatella]MBS4751014.1 acyl carrier protein [Carnobacteriaceae bacterium zg-ZUI78]NEW62826.1 acyl carrier protein [Granulicatella sp. zg-ZJ]NEW65482.1 acyl carrier protein [Granulicatella sp. zg-84]QMI85273.1 acyl carrier protein [Carnobacteriaceae bacterium zg-84]